MNLWHLYIYIRERVINGQKGPIIYTYANRAKLSDYILPYTKILLCYFD